MIYSLEEHWNTSPAAKGILGQKSPWKAIQTWRFAMAALPSTTK